MTSADVPADDESAGSDPPSNALRAPPVPARNRTSAAIEEMGGKQLRRYGEFCGGALALACGRAGDAAMIGGYLGDDDAFDHAIGEFAAAYADITEADHASHLAAIARGDVAAVHDL